MPWCLLPWIQLWDSLSFLDFLEVYFLPSDCESSPSLFIQISFHFLLFLFSFWHPYDSGVGTFKVVPEVPIFSHFLNSCFFILFWLNVYFFLPLQIIDLSSVSFPSLLVPCIYIFLFHFTYPSLFPLFCDHTQSIL